MPASIAVRTIRQNGRLENIEKIRDQLQAIPYQEIRDIFLNPELPSVETIEFGRVDREKVLDYLCVQKSFSTDRVAGSLDRLHRAQENRSQSLEKWFG